MGSIISAANSKGANKVGTTCEHAPIGHAPKVIKGKFGMEGTIQLRVGDRVDARTKVAKHAVNSDLLADGWVHHVHNNCLIHRDTGATLKITRNFWHNAYKPGAYKVRARYTRTG